MVAHTCDPSTWEVRQEDKKEFKVTSLGYRVCLRPAWATFTTGHLLKHGTLLKTMISEKPKFAQQCADKKEQTRQRSLSGVTHLT